MFAAVQNLITDIPSDFVLVTYEDYAVSNKRRSDVYAHYNVLCKKITKKSAGWLVYNYVLTGDCLVDEGTRRYCIARDTYKLRGHPDLHRTSTEERTLHRCKMDEKRFIAEDSARTAKLDILPLSFVIKR